MCSVCLKSPCDNRCPNAPEPPAVFACEYCDEPIVEGDRYVELDGEHYHEECFSDCAEELLFDEYGASRGVAEVEDEC